MDKKNYTPIEYIKNWIEVGNAMLGFLYKLALISGICIVFIYCIHIGFYPQSLTIGDTLLFVFSLFAIASIDIIGVVYGAISTSWIVFLLAKVINRYASYIFPEDFQSNDIPILRYPVQKFRPKAQVKMRLPPNGWFGSLISLLVFLMFLLPLLDTNNKSTWHAQQLTAFIISFYAAGFMFNIGLIEFAPTKNKGNTERNQINPFQKLIIPASVLIVPIIVGSPMLMLETAMNMIGLRIEGMPVQLDAENYKKTTEIANKFNIPIHDCKINASDDYIVYGVNVLWHGIGNAAYVQIGAHDVDRQRKGIPFAEFKLKDDGISPIKTGQKLPTCINLKADTLFDLHKWNIRQESAGVLNALKIQLKEMGPIEGISITGYSDSIPATSPDNWTLSRLRAESVKNWLLTQLPLKPTQVIAIGKGTLNALIICPPKLKGLEMASCQEPNRRVEIIVRTKSK